MAGAMSLDNAQASGAVLVVLLLAHAELPPPTYTPSGGRGWVPALGAEGGLAKRAGVGSAVRKARGHSSRDGRKGPVRRHRILVEDGCWSDSRERDGYVRCLPG